MYSREGEDGLGEASLALYCPQMISVRRLSQFPNAGWYVGQVAVAIAMISSSYTL